MMKKTHHIKVNSQGQRSIISILCLYIFILLSGCITPKLPSDEAVKVFDDAIDRLVASSDSWQDVLEDTRDELIKQGQSTLANEVSNVLSRAISDLSIEARCYTDFMRDRVKEDLIRMRAKLTGENPSLTPVFCNPTPKTVDMNLPPERRPFVQISGYNLDAANVTIYLLDIQGQQSDVTFALGNPSRYLLTLNLGGNGVPLTNLSDKLIFVLSREETRSINIIQPFTPTPRSVPSIYTVTVHTGCVEHAGTDANVYITLFGSRSDSDETLLDTTNYDDHEECTATTYEIRTRDDLGDLRFINIRHDNKNDGPGWFLGWVKVKHSMTGREWVFPCQRWLDRTEEDTQISRNIYQNGPCN